ncbi:MAG: hypothetical protein JOZ83_01885, partial [Silvibacterium sp.]|nr:hypothetical protein [Silvibacterium sp.]
MTATVFLVLLFSIFWIKARSLEAAVLDVYLPCFLFIPYIYGFRLPHMPGLDFGSAPLTPIAIFLLIRYGREWKFTRSDLWLALFTGGAVLTEVLHSDMGTAGLIFFDILFRGVMPYMLGKLLLERGDMRERFVRRLVFLMAFIAIVSVWEYRMSMNLFNRVEDVVFG